MLGVWTRRLSRLLPLSHWRLRRTLPLSLVLALAACAPPAAPNAARPPVATAVPVRVLGTPTPGRAYRVGLSVPDRRGEPWRSIVAGAREEAARLGVELSVPEASGEGGAERQAREVRELLERLLDFLLLGGGEGPVLAPALDEAAAQAMPIGALSSLVPVDRVVFKVGPDRQALGRVQAECLGTMLHGRGQVALLAGPRDHAPPLEQAQGFKETLHRQFPNLQLVAERAASLDRAAAESQTAEWLTQWPELAGLAAGSDAPTLGILDALWDAGRLGRTKVAAINVDAIGEASLRDGGLHCAAMQQSVAEGRAAVRNAVAYLSYQPYEKNVKSPPLLVTRETVDRVDWGLIRGSME